MKEKYIYLIKCMSVYIAKENLYVNATRIVMNKKYTFNLKINSVNSVKRHSLRNGVKSNTKDTFTG